MSVPFNETQVIQTALNLLGYPLIQSVASGGKPAAVLENLYDALLAADLSSPNWRFATKVVTLSQIAGLNPNFKWYTAAYQIPPDCLAIWQVYPGVPFEVFGEQIWTSGATQLPPPVVTPPPPGPAASAQQLQLMYRHAGPVSLYPASYIMYFCYLLAVSAGPAITDDPKILAQLNADMAKWRAQAMVVNSQGHPNMGLTNSRWVQGRVSGSFYGTWYGSN